MDDGWKVQYNRMMRWKKRLDDIEPLNFDDPVFLEDCLYTLYVNCWHLRDWLLRGADKELKRKINKFTNNDPLMQKCRCLANTLKHLELREYYNKTTKEIITFPTTRLYGTSGPLTSTGGASAEFENIPINDSAFDTISSMQLSNCYATFDDGDAEDLFNLIDEIIIAWDRFLENEGLM